MLWVSIWLRLVWKSVAPSNYKIRKIRTLFANRRIGQAKVLIMRPGTPAPRVITHEVGVVVCDAEVIHNLPFAGVVHAIHTHPLAGGRK